MSSPHKRAHSSSVGAADGVMLAVVTIWAGNNVLTKAALDDQLSPLVYVFLRFFIVAALLFAGFLATGRDARIRRADYRRFLLTGISGYALYNLLFVVGLSKTSAFSAAILVGLAPIFTLLIARGLGWEPVQRLQWVGIGVAFAGVAIFLGDKVVAGEPAIGDVLNILAAMSFSVYGLATRDLVVRYGAPVTTAWSVLIGLVAVLPLTLPAVAREDWSGIGRLGWGSVLYASVLSMLVAYSLWAWAITRRGAGRTVPYLFLIPVITGILSVAFLDDHLTAAQLAGGGIALIGVAIARWFAVSGGKLSERPIQEAAALSVPAERQKQPLPGP